MKAGRHVCQKEVAIAKKYHGDWNQLIILWPIDMLPFFRYPKQHQPSLPVFKTILAPTLLLFLLLPKGTVFLENIFCCFSGLLPSYPPSEERTVTSGLHLYWVRFQSPPPLLKSSSIPPTGFQRPWLACPSLAGFVPTLPPHPWGFSAAPA